MSQKKSKQPQRQLVKARALFKIKADNKIVGGITYKNGARQEYISGSFSDIVDVFINGGVSGLNKDKRVQPNSITISFNLI